MVEREQTCCFIGHREIEITEELKNEVFNAIEELVRTKDVRCFLFGSASQFDALCHEQVTKIKKLFPRIERIYVRAEYPSISEQYKNYLSEDYEDTYYPEKLSGAGRAVYVERNYEMIDKSEFCIVYYDESYIPGDRKSGAKIAYDYALKKGREIIRFPLSYIS